MTKMKSKKMTKSTFAIIIMAIAMVAMLAFGGTYAYFTATADKAESTAVKTATIAIKEATVAIELAENMENVLPGDTVTVDASVTNESNRKIYLFIKYNVTLPESTTAKDVALDLTVSGWDAYEADGVENVYYTTLEASTQKAFEATGTFEGSEVSDEGVTDGTIMNADLKVTVRFAATQFEDGAGEVAVADAYALISSSLDLA